jgi:hydroxymethylpyrimidine/phosphomethylpyrimidine kinase
MGMTAIALTIAGSDSSGGAGIQADLKTFSALGVYGASIITAITAQNTRGVTAVHDVPVDIIAAQMDAVFSDLPVATVKIGMLSRAETIETIAERLEHWGKTSVVLDPVMVATSGDQLLRPDAVTALIKRLLPLAIVVTPNLPEAAVMLDTKIATDEQMMQDQAIRLLALGPQAVLIKGGHGNGEESVDFLVTQDGVLRLAATRINTRNTHGTGCTLSAAVAAGMAKGMKLDAAAKAAKDYLTQALGAADRLRVGHSHGPVHHFHAIW